MGRARTCSYGLLFVAFAVALGLAAGELAAEEPATGDFGETTSILAVELPVRVLLDGRPLRGLTAEDFEVYDRGERRELSGFEVIDLSQAGDAPSSIALPADALPEDAVPAAAPRTFLLLFDLAYADGLSLTKALAASRELTTERLHPGDRVALAFFSALRGLRVLVEPTAEPERLRLGLDLVQSLLAREPGRAGELHDALSQAASTAAVPLASREEVVAEAGIVVRVDPFWPHRSVIRSLARALATLDRWWPRLEGQRTLFFLSHGFDPRYLTGHGSAGTLSELERAFRSLRRSGWVVQAINIGGLRAGGGRETLFYLAVETGGESFENFNDVSEAMTRALDRTSVTYLLTFQTDDVEPDGHFHRLRVRLRNGPHGARLLHRPGYYAPEAPRPVP